MTKTQKNKNDNRSLLQRYAAAPHILWAVLFIVAPLIFVVYYAFTDASGIFTTSNITEFFTPAYTGVTASNPRNSL